tara:strand:- start:340 stop:747 length:408 start_codon:yes stop_codon:yes gene_type:complete
VELEENGVKERQDELRKSGTIKLQGKDYLPVAHRVAIMRAEHPDWCIETGYTVHSFNDKEVLVARCVIANEDGRMLATATKTVTAGGKGPAGKYPLEMAETGAIGRALASCGYGTLSGDLNEGDQIADMPQKGSW